MWHDVYYGIFGIGKFGKSGSVEIDLGIKKFGDPIFGVVGIGN